MHVNLQSDTTASEAWALGGWLDYKSGWLANVFRLGATGYRHSRSMRRRLATARCSLGDAGSSQLGLQLTDQRAAGDHFLGRFSTWNVGARAQFHWRGASLIAAMSATGPGAALRTPYGAWPGYLHMTILDFDRANETAWGLRVGYDWSAGGLPLPRIPGLSMLLFYAQGDDAHTPATRAPLPLRREGDLDIIWRSRLVKGLQYRFRNGYADDGGAKIVKEFRIHLDYQRPLL